MGLQLKAGGKFHLKLNIDRRPIANKYREGKLKSTPKGELKYLKSLWWKRVPYLARQEIIKTSKKAFCTLRQVMNLMVF